MSVLVESQTPEIINKPVRKTVSATEMINKPLRKSISSNKVSSYRESNNNESIKKKSVIRRSKKNLNSQNFRHSMHEVSVNINDLQENQHNNTTENSKSAKHPEKVRLSRSRSFHFTEDHNHNMITQRDRAQILRQYISSKDSEDINKLIENNNIKRSELLNSSLPIHDAIQQKYEQDTIKDLALFLLKHETVNLEQKNNEGQTPLQFAVSLELHDVVRLLIAFGATVNCKDAYGDSALRYAVDNGDFEMASLLISHGANASVVQNGF